MKARGRQESKEWWFLAVEIGTDGMAHDIRVIRMLGHGLDEKAVECVSQWRFRPGTKDGVEVAVQATIEVSFRLQDSR